MQPRALSNVPAQFAPRVVPADVSHVPPYDSAAPINALLHAHRSMSAVVAGAEQFFVDAVPRGAVVGTTYGDAVVSKATVRFALMRSAMSCARINACVR